MPPTLQSLLGLFAGLLIGAAMYAAGRIPIPIPLAGWIAIFVLIWIAVFFALRRKLAVLVVTAFLTTGLFSLSTQHLLPNVPRASPINPSSTTVPTATP